MATEGYIHGESATEQDRLLAQAEILAPYVLPAIDLDGARTVLEVGMGVGAETRLLRARWPEARFVGLDLSARQLLRAREVLAADVARGEVAIARASATKLPIASRSVDAAVLIWLLEHVPNPQAVVDECARALKPGGRLFAIEVYNRSLLVEPKEPIIDEYFAALSTAQARAGGHPDIAARLPQMAAKAGLTVERFVMNPVHGDARDRAAAVRLIRYFEGLCRSAEPQIVAAGLFDAARVPEVWRAFDRVVEAPEPLLLYTNGQLAARKG
jgi:SAM-dependent methyltransferase